MRGHEAGGGKRGLDQPIRRRLTTPWSLPPIAKISSLYRYPVKSMAGEQVQALLLTWHGVADDRLFAFESTGAPAGMLRLTGQERRHMLRYHPHLLPSGEVQVRTPTGEVLPVSSLELLTHLQTHIPGASTISLTHAATPQTDVRPLSLISLETIASLTRALAPEPESAHLDPRRFRANFYIEVEKNWLDQARDGTSSRPDSVSLRGGAFPEDRLTGRCLRLGETARILIRERDPRCRFITYDPECPHLAEPLYSLMKLLERHHQGRAGVYASVLTPGPVRTGDPIWLEPVKSLGTH